MAALECDALTGARSSARHRRSERCSRRRCPPPPAVWCPGWRRRTHRRYERCPRRRPPPAARCGAQGGADAPTGGPSAVPAVTSTCCREARERRTQRSPRSSWRASRRSDGRIFCSRADIDDRDRWRARLTVSFITQPQSTRTRHLSGDFVPVLADRENRRARAVRTQCRHGRSRVVFCYKIPECICYKIRPWPHCDREFTNTGHCDNLHGEFAIEFPASLLQDVEVRRGPRSSLDCCRGHCNSPRGRSHAPVRNFHST